MFILRVKFTSTKQFFTFLEFLLIIFQIFIWKTVTLRKIYTRRATNPAFPEGSSVDSRVRYVYDSRIFRGSSREDVQKAERGTVTLVQPSHRFEGSALESEQIADSKGLSRGTLHYFHFSRIRLIVMHYKSHHIITYNHIITSYNFR